jgi:capping protein alpha
VYPDLSLCISSGLFAPAKFWNGRWTSVWKYGAGKLTGAVNVNVHYFEKGNVHKKVSFTSPQIAVAEDAQAIVAAIGQAELGFHRQVTEEAAAIKESFKSLRRALPVSPLPTPET